LVDICGYELPTNLQNFTQKDLTVVKIIFQKVLGAYFFETPCRMQAADLQPVLATFWTMKDPAGWLTNRSPRLSSWWKEGLATVFPRTP